MKNMKKNYATRILLTAAVCSMCGLLRLTLPGALRWDQKTGDGFSSEQDQAEEGDNFPYTAAPLSDEYNEEIYQS